MADGRKPYVSRGGVKLAAALGAFGLEPVGWVCADLGCSAGGFTDCLLEWGAAKVYAVDTGAGVLDYRLRTDPRVACLERTNAMHLVLPEPCGLVTIDLGWTRQKRILPTAMKLLIPGGHIVSLVKPQYEADPNLLRRGVVPEEHLEAVLDAVSRVVARLALEVAGRLESPIRGHGGNREFLWWLRPRETAPVPGVEHSEGPQRDDGESQLGRQRR